MRALLFALLFLALPAVAVEPEEILDDPALEARARAISKDLRCLVCQNQSIDDSNAELARDLRVLVRERLVAGDSDQQVVEFVVARYGDFVLLNPPVKPHTWLLWFGPVIILILAASGVALYVGRRARPIGIEAEPLTAEERARINAVLRDKDKP
ncbi:MAG: cytochrome c-type biogenesis protein CcmH [Alphaproteobacteria bacterium]|nr:cytochrome c-type biogenesis protein CcmH [Alphaproteobacteria bacterium]